jgi:hypothetical protein
MGFRSGFDLGKKVATERVKLAREYAWAKHDSTQEYINQRTILETFSELFFEESGKVIGYAVGTYTSFCPFQSTLNLFDERVDRYKTRIA